MMVKYIYPGALIQLFAGIARSTTPDLPYNPAYIWTQSGDNGPLAYVLSPKSSTSSEFQLKALDISAPFDASAPRFVGPSTDPPSPADDGAKSTVPIPNNDGLPMVYTGDCRSGWAEIWRFAPNPEISDGDGTWSKSSLMQRDSDEEVESIGPNYLAAAITFPNPKSEAPPDIYVFGGMCPTAANDDSWTWISAANYSRAMISLQPPKSSEDNVYEVSVLPNLSPPVDEAGFTMTPLLPAVSNSSSGRQLRQQSFALIGGHTQEAFLNMSRIALFSLPEGSWSYVSVNSPSDNLPTRMKDQGIEGIEPRSGHTAILAPDGDKLIILGGWVGDITVPAQPQLAVLHLGEDYGGSGDWTWSIPRDSNNGLRPGTGIFGHGAAMLPGGIMAVIGGYEISGSSKRSNLGVRDASQLYLFNVTSESWITSYAPPKVDSSGDSSGPLSSAGQKAGLGVGLGVGLSAAAAGIVILFCVRTRHKRAHRKAREQELRNLALGAERPHVSLDEVPGGLYQPMVQVNRKKVELYARHSSNPGNRNDWSDNGASIAERTGLLLDSSARSPKRAIQSRTYQPATFSEDLRRTPTFRSIHPIEEGEEHAENNLEANIEPVISRETKRDSKSSVISDPFKDPPSPIKACLPPPITPSRNGDGSKLERRHSLGSNDWGLGEVSGWPTQTPDKADRTSSNLSESSRSSMSTSSYRTSSMRLDQVVAQAPVFRPRQTVLSGDTSYETSRNLSLQSHAYDYLAPHLLNDGATFPSQYLERMYTFESHGQKGSGSLLGAGSSSLLPSERKDPPTQNKNKALEWVGSVRRALSLVKKPENDRNNSPCSDLVPSMERSTSSSPTKSFHSAQELASAHLDMGAGLPRRAVSTNSSVLRRKKGAKDWDVGQSSAERSALLRRETYDGTLSFDGGIDGGRISAATDLKRDDDEEEEDWDVEAAAQGRLVQVTFTVPKEKLRVVNVGDEDTLDYDDDGNDRERDTTNDITSLDTKKNNVTDEN
uniref:Galactose oxidase n=1 Tax=Coccidioides posadasii RMSCC 3488 TaxID=454284 RepID=A0A0J6FJK8_COCPO|nr:hypothetical protein CPAG_09650 [Coccidioides posadasii RMSCC 3488]